MLARSTPVRVRSSVHSQRVSSPRIYVRIPAQPVACRSHSNGSSSASSNLHAVGGSHDSATREVMTVADAMTTGRIFTCRVNDTVDTALALLVNNRITGLPVVDNANRVVGVVSDFDLLALDTMGRTNTEELFPSTEQTWQAFKEVKSMLNKSSGKLIKDVMTAFPIVVTSDTCLNDATRTLLTKKIRRLPVVDNDGKLVGLISRSNIIKAALESRQNTLAESN